LHKSYKLRYNKLSEYILILGGLGGGHGGTGIHNENTSSLITCYSIKKKKILKINEEGKE